MQSDDYAAARALAIPQILTSNPFASVVPGAVRPRLGREVHPKSEQLVDFDLTCPQLETGDGGLLDIFETVVSRSAKVLNTRHPISSPLTRFGS